jgi:GSCFA family
MTHPYRGLPSHQFWNTGVAQSSPGGLDPMTNPKFLIGPTDKVATMGSCFAQHISRHLMRRGLSYFVTEQGDPSMPPEELAARNFGVFSARYGNVYTVRQAVQLFDRAFGEFSPKEGAWKSGDGFVDPFRPQIEPHPLKDEDDVDRSRLEHLEAVRRLFTEADILVFTLGLTETFMSQDDGSVFPVAPGVSGGIFDPDRYTFVNFTVSEVINDLRTFVHKVRDVNPTIRFVLTVSPVPLIATYEPRHVLVSTTISKAILRVAAHEISSSHDFVEYFPSYEIISGSALGSQYFDDDLRQVRQVGVDHVMRVFEKHMLGLSASTANQVLDHGRRETRGNVVCDEETIMRAIEESGSN